MAVALSYDPDRPSWSTPAVCAALGVTRTEINYWVRGMPLPLARPGTGYRRRWSPREVVAIAICRHLRDSGLSILVAAPAAVVGCHGDRGEVLYVRPEGAVVLPAEATASVSQPFHALRLAPVWDEVEAWVHGEAAA
ncbi:MAG TPA: MerR family transcriptional regulator [Acidimicrobiales bacterium]